MESALSPEPIAAALGIPAADLALIRLHLTTTFARRRRGVETRLISAKSNPTPMQP